MRQVCFITYPRLIHLITIKRLSIIDYLEDVFDYIVLVALLHFLCYLFNSVAVIQSINLVLGIQDFHGRFKKIRKDALGNAILDLVTKPGTLSPIIRVARNILVLVEICHPSFMLHTQCGPYHRRIYAGQVEEL